MPDLRRSLIINFFSSSGATLVQFLVSIALARMLSPSEIGVFSMTAVFVNIAHMFRDFGVANYIQREADLTEDKIRSALGVLYTTSWTLALILFGMSGFLGEWFNEPGIVPVMRVLALGFIFIPFGSLTHSMLLRELEAGKQAIVTAIGTISYCASCLILASLDFGTLSLAWANFINIVVSGLAYALFRPKGMPWLPSLRGWGRIVHFGVGSLLTNCIEAINGSIPDIMLGKLSNAHNVGLFSRANSTVSIFTYVAGNSVTYGSVSYLSQAYHRKESLVPMLSRAMVLLTGIGWPALALTVIFAQDIVLALYGPSWLGSVPAVLPLSVAAAIYLFFLYTFSSMIAIGKPYLAAIPQFATLVMRIFLGYFFFNGVLSSFGWAMCFATLTVVPVQMLLQWRYVRFSPLAMVNGVTPSILVTLCCAIAGVILHPLLPGSVPPILRLLIALPPLVAVWYGALRIIDHPLLGEVHHLMKALSGRLQLLARTLRA
jgi:O-antigen/teichoic acid export membrane protein